MLCLCLTRCRAGATSWQQRSLQRTGQVADWPAMLTMLRCVLCTPRTAQLLSDIYASRPSGKAGTVPTLQTCRPHNLLSVPRTANPAHVLVPVLSVAASLCCCYYVRFRTQYSAPPNRFHHTRAVTCTFDDLDFISMQIYSEFKIF